MCFDVVLLWQAKAQELPEDQLSGLPAQAASNFSEGLSQANGQEARLYSEYTIKQRSARFALPSGIWPWSGFVDSAFSLCCLWALLTLSSI